MEPQFQYEIRFLTIEHLPEILKLQTLVIENLSDKDSYYQEPLLFFERVLADGKSCLGLFDGESLIGFHMASFPGKDEYLGNVMGCSDKDWGAVVQWGPAAIHPSYRNRGLLKVLADKHLQILIDRGYEHIYLTIAPRNYPSLCSSMRQGFLIKQLKYKFGHLLRYVLHLDVKRSCKQPVCQVRVDGSDLASQQFLLQLGFYGSGVVRNNMETEILFGHDGLIG